ncbi:TPA: hypothetical protein ACH3X2_004220 [Trebouxia sp. C0005]
MAVKQPSAALHACTIRAASLEYRYEGIEDDVVLTTCESLNFGGQVEPTQAELDQYDHVLPMDCNKLSQGKEALLKVTLIQLADRASILSVTLAHCIADGSGFTRLLQSLALMCSNQPGLPMTFGAANLNSPELIISKEAFADCDNIIQEHLHQASLVFQPKTDLSSRVKLASRLLPGLCSSMAGSKCKQVVYLPAMAVQTLKAKMQLLIPSQKLSTNDVLSTVLWHVACDIRGRPRPCQPSCAGHGCLAYPLNLRSMHVPQQYCGNALLVNLLGGGDIARSEAPAALAGKCYGGRTSSPHVNASGYEKSNRFSGSECDLQQLAHCASCISRHTCEARMPDTAQEALGLVEGASGGSALAKRLGLCVLGVDVDLWLSNWSNLYQLEGMQIGDAKPYLFLGHSIGPQLGTAAVILQPDKSCYHVDWYIPSKLSKKLMQHEYWSSLLPGSAWL